MEDKKNKTKLANSDARFKKFKRSCEHKVRDSDLFGKKIYLTHKGQEAFNTTIGGMISILFAILMLAYVLTSFEKVWNHVLKSVTFQSLYIDQSNTDTSIKHLSIGQTGFDFAVGFINILPSEIGSIEAQLVKVENGIKKKQPLPLNRCDDSALWLVNGKKTFNFLFCPDTSNLDFQAFNIQGDYFSDQFFYIQLQFLQCRFQQNQNKSCADADSVKNFFLVGGNKLQVLFRDSNVNIENQDNLLTSFINSKTVLPYSTWTVSSANLFFRPGYIDSTSAFEPGRYYVKMQAAEYSLQESSDNTELGNMKVYLRIDSFYEKVAASYWDFLTVASAVGGLFTALFRTGQKFVGFFSGTMFEAKIIKQLFLKRRTKEEFLQLHTNQQNKDAQPIIVPNATEVNLTNSGQTGTYKISPADIKNMLFEILVHRQKFSISIRKIIFVYLSFVIKTLYRILKCCKCRQDYQDTLAKIKKDNDLYFKARKRYYEELDIIQILKKINEGSNHRTMALSNQQRMLLQFASNNMIELDIVNEGKKNKTSPQAVDIFDSLQTSLYSKNTVVSLWTLGTINSILKVYAEPNFKFKKIDKQLISGVYQKTQDEVQKELIRTMTGTSDNTEIQQKTRVKNNFVLGFRKLAEDEYYENKSSPFVQMQKQIAGKFTSQFSTLKSQGTPLTVLDDTKMNSLFMTSERKLIQPNVYGLEEELSMRELNDREDEEQFKASELMYSEVPLQIQEEQLKADLTQQIFQSPLQDESILQIVEAKAYYDLSQLISQESPNDNLPQSNQEKPFGNDMPPMNSHDPVKVSLTKLMSDGPLALQSNQLSQVHLPGKEEEQIGGFKSQQIKLEILNDEKPLNLEEIIFD